MAPSIWSWKERGELVEFQKWFINMVDVHIIRIFLMELATMSLTSGV